MKKYQQKINFPKLSKEEKNCNKPSLKRDISYECVFSDSSNYNLIVRNKKMKKENKPESENRISEITIHNQNRQEISFSELLQNIIDEDKKSVENETIKKDNKKIEKEAIKKENKNIENEIIKKEFETTKKENKKIENEEIITSKTINQNLDLISKNYKGGLNYNQIYNEFVLKVDIESIKSWNEIFAPKCLENFVCDNRTEILKFRNWLTAWKRTNGNEKPSKKAAYSDDSDFDVDFEDKKTVKKGKKTVVRSKKTVVRSKKAFYCVIIGPTGSGKTSLVYAIAKELDYKVLEMNCSSRRTGKDIMDKLIQCTESHHVNMVEKVSIKSSTNSKKRKSKISVSEPPNKKYKAETLPQMAKQKSGELSIKNDSLLLFDDADVIMEEDRGFWGGICSAIMKKSRPIILTCTDQSEAQKFINKLPKFSCLTINLELKKQENVTCYMQTILLSRGQVTEHKEVQNWLGSLNNRNLDVRSAINNLHFDSASNNINYRFKHEFNDWNRFNFKKELNNTKDSEEIANLNPVLKIQNGYLKETSQNNKIIRTLTAMTEVRSQFNSHSLQEKVNDMNWSEKYSAITHFDKSIYNPSSLDLGEDIEETMITLYNSCQQRSLSEFDEDILLSSSYKHEIPKIEQPQKYKVKLNNIKSMVCDRNDYIDRVGALRTMSASENHRKNNLTERRFTHYFDRRKLKFSDSDLTYLSTPFKK